MKEAGNRRIFRIPVIFLFLFPLYFQSASAQEMPPRPLSVNLTQNLNFGIFSPGISGGTLTISPQGFRSASGTVVLIQQGFSFEAIFEIDANPGTLVSFLIGPDIIMNGSNGGSMTLHPGPSYPASPVITTAVPPAQTQVHLGGTLTVGNDLSNPPGNYSGFLYIMFIQD